MAGCIQVALVEIQAHNTGRLGVDPLLEIARTAHCEFQKGTSREHTLLVEAVLDAIVKPVDVLQDAITRVQVVAIVELVLEGIIGRIAGEMRQHDLSHRHVNARPDVVCNRSVITVLSLLEYAILVGLVLARAHDAPTHGFRVLAALDDRVVLHTFLFFVLHHSARVHWNVHDLGIGLARC